VLRRARFLHGLTTSPDGVKDVTWIDPDGKEKTDEDWANGWERSICLMLAGNAGDDRGAPGAALLDDTLLIMLNAHHEQVAFVMPEAGKRTRWQLEIDTGKPDLAPEACSALAAGARFEVPGRTLLVWRLEQDGNPLPSAP
jgi:glycogen operon protein